MTTLRRVPPEIADMFADAMELLPLCQWRRTSRSNYRYACASLLRALTTRVGRFVPKPQQFIDTVTRHGAVFGGQLALSFILRQDSIDLTSMDLYATHAAYERLCDDILDDSDTHGTVQSYTASRSNPAQVRKFLVTETLVIHLSSGMTICVHQSYTTSPIAPIARAPCTALSNFVTGYGFACSHPELTLGHRGLLADECLPLLRPRDASTLDLLLSHNFSLVVSPTAWPEYRFDMGDDGSTLADPEECWQDKYICPCQGRFFGDSGSFVDFIDPLDGDEARCKENRVPPFGAMVIWRLMSTFECVMGCCTLVDVFQRGVRAIPVFIDNSPVLDLRGTTIVRSARFKNVYGWFGKRRYPPPLTG